METARHCAYNVTRNVLLSERVWCASESVEQSQLLELVMNGPGLDRHAGVWIRRTPGWVDLPRLVALDFIYVNEQHKIVELGGIGLSAGFPPVGEHVAGALILANRRLSEAGVTISDEVRLCGQGELAALVKATSPSAIEAATARTPSAAGPVSESTSTPFQVSRYSEFVFEPFAGSLVYLPSAEAPSPQSSEFFLPERATARQQEPAGEESEEAARKETGSPATDAEAKSARKARKRARQASRKPHESEEEPRFYTPKPIRFFDPAAAGAGQPEPENPSGGEETPLREPTHLSPELKAAILQIDEQLRREKEELAPEKKKGRKKKPANSAEGEAIEQEPVGTAHPGWQELAEPPGPSESMIAAEAHAVEKILEEAETAAETTLELRPERGSAPEIELVPESLAESPVDDSGADGEEVSFSGMVSPVQEHPAPAEAAYEVVPPVEATSSPDEATLADPVPSAEEVPFPTEVEDAEFAWPAEDIPSTEEVIPTAPAESEVVAFASSAETEPARALPIKKAPEPAEVLPIKKAPKPAPIESAPPVRSPAEEPRPAKAKPSLGKRLQRWIGREIGEKRRGERTAVPGLVAFYWSGGAPRPHEVVNISKSGFYLRTKELWLPDTLVRMTLQRSEEVKGSSRESIRVLARVVRIDDGGVGHEFVTSDALRNVRSRDVLPADGTDPKELEKFLKAEQGKGTRK